MVMAMTMAMAMRNHEDGDGGPRCDGDGDHEMVMANRVLSFFFEEAMLCGQVQPDCVCLVVMCLLCSSFCNKAAPTRQNV